MTLIAEYNSDRYINHSPNNTQQHNFLIERDDVGNTCSPPQELQSKHISNREEQDNPEASLHPISCTRCRKMHKFCTRTKPACERCISKGIECEYAKPRKQINKSKCFPSPSTSTTSSKRKREDSSVDENSNETLSSYKKLSKESISNCHAVELLPWYFSNPLQLNMFISLKRNGTNCIINDKEEFDKYIQQYETCEISDSNKRERRALFYSIQSLNFQIIGDQKQAQQSSLKSRKYISKTNDPLSLLNSYTYLNLALYEMGCGEFSISKFHLHCAKYYSQNIMKPVFSIQETKNWKTISFVENFSLQEVDVLQFYSSLPNLYEMVTGIQLHPQIANILLQPITQENNLEIMQTGIEVIKLIITNVRDKILNNPKETWDEHLNGLRFSQELLIEGLRLGIMVSITSRKDLIEESSLRITYLSQKDCFNNCCMFMIPFFIMAARVNLQVVKSIESGLRENNQLGRGPDEGFIPIDYYTVLKSNLRSLTCLDSRFKRVSTVHDKLLENIQDILQRQDQVI